MYESDIYHIIFLKRKVPASIWDAGMDSIQKSLFILQIGKHKAITNHFQEMLLLGKSGKNLSLTVLLHYRSSGSI